VAAAGCQPDVPAAVRRASAGAVGAVSFVAAVASYTHMLDLARHAGEGRLTPLLPISVDGPVVAGSNHDRRPAPQRTRRLARLAGSRVGVGHRWPPALWLALTCTRI
jgi:hypothetical protein